MGNGVALEGTREKDGRDASSRRYNHQIDAIRDREDVLSSIFRVSSIGEIRFRKNLRDKLQGR